MNHEYIYSSIPDLNRHVIIIFSLYEYEKMSVKYTDEKSDAIEYLLERGRRQGLVMLT